MEKLKKLFSTPARKVMTIVCIVLILAIAGAGTVMAVRANAQHNAIGEENAQNFAFADAGVDPAAARVERTEFEFENGQFVYDVEFVADGAEYDYLIKASDGTVIKKEVERVRGGEVGSPASASLTVDEAKNAALSDVGLRESDVTFTKARLDTEDGFAVYDIEFYTEEAEYEYEINAETGEVFSRSREVWDGGRPSAQPSASPSEAPSASPAGEEYISATEAEDAALADAGLSTSDVTFTKEKFDRDDGRAVYDIEFYSGDAEYEYEIDAVTGDVISRSKEIWDGGRPGTQPTASPSETPTASPAGDGYVGLDAAKSAALADAGLSASDVTFTKQVFDRENGRAVYEIEFYGADAEYEYEYEIDAATGEVISRSKELLGGSRPAQPSASPSEAPTATPAGDDYIGLDAAKSAGLADAGLSASDVTFTKQVFDRENGRAVYDIEFYSADAEYDYEIDAVTGEVISRSTELLPAAQPSASPTGDSFIGEEAAKSAALADAGISASDATFTKQELDRDHGHTEYEIEFYSGGVEYEYKIDASTGAVLERDLDRDHH